MAISQVNIFDKDGLAVALDAELAGGKQTPQHGARDGALVSIGAMNDAAAGSDAGTFSLIGLFKRLLGKFPATLGTKAAANSLSVSLSIEDAAEIGGVTETAPATDTASSGLNGRLQRVAQSLTLLLARLPLVLGQGTMATSLKVAIASDQSPLPGYAFDVAVTPAVTNGAYSAGDIIGGLLTFPVARINDEKIIVLGAEVVSKAAVLPVLTLVLFNADPTATTKTDNAVYSLAAADAFKVVATISFGTGWYDHGTPNTIRADGLNIVAAPVAGGQALYGLLIDATGVTLTSTSDIQVRLRGLGS